MDNKERIVELNADDHIEYERIVQILNEVFGDDCKGWMWGTWPYKTKVKDFRVWFPCLLYTSPSPRD